MIRLFLLAIFALITALAAPVTFGPSGIASVSTNRIALGDAFV
jgi:hypothetical protein